jgi:signal transduction histidine kinase
LKQDGEIVAWNLAVQRAALQELGLDWAASAEPLRAPAIPAPAPAGLSFWEPLAVAAGTLALLAGVVVVTLQRRMLKAYTEAEQLTEAHQRKLIEAQLALVQSQKLEALGTLATGIAHDFNNLLSVIRMSNHFVAAAVKPEGTTKENIEAIEQAVAQGRDLVRSMLGYARRADDHAMEFPVVSVVSDTLGMLSRQFLSGLTLSLELVPDCPPVKGSGSRLEQILLNLVINASEATRGQGRITVTARVVAAPHPGVLPPASARRYVELSVTDSGPGIAPEHLPRVFEPFFTTKAGGAQAGTGLGLSVVYTLARQSGWGLDVESKPGEGARFRVLLPASESDAS